MQLALWIAVACVGSVTAGSLVGAYLAQTETRRIRKGKPPRRWKHSRRTDC